MHLCEEEVLVTLGLAELVQRVEGGLGERGPGARAQGAHGAASQPALVAGFERLLQAGGRELGLGLAAPDEVATGVVAAEPALQAGGLLAAPAVRGGHFGRDGGVGFVVPALHHGGGGAELAQGGQGLDAVLRFLAAAAMKADAAPAQAGGAGGIFGLAAAVHKEHHAVAAGRGLVFFHAPANALFGQQALQEGEVTLAVLHAVAAPAFVARAQALSDVGRHVFVPVPGGNAGVVGEHVFDDLDHALVLPDAALQAMTEQRNPGAHQQCLAGQAAVALQGPGLGHVAAAARLAAVGQGGQQGDGARVELFELHVGVQHQGVEVERKGLGHRIVQHEALDHQVGGQRAFAAGRGQGVEAGVGAPLAQQVSERAFQKRARRRQARGQPGRDVGRNAVQNAARSIAQRGRQSHV